MTEKMQDILITCEGKVLSRVCSAETLEGVASYLAPYPEVFIVYDTAVRPYAERIEALTGSKGLIGLDATEKTKDMSTVLGLCETLLEKGADRNALLLAVGGGITTDMAGFAASIYKRGIRFAYLPTTLLGQVDAALGGKTGVNFLNYKNILGVIRQPEFTFECAEVLQSLPYRDFKSGTAEMLKTFIIDNAENNYSRAVAVLSDIASSEKPSAAIKAHRTELMHLIHAAAAIKAGVVSRDQFEKGERKLLNLGHTFAHAIEWKSNAEGGGFSHGEAVGIGIKMAAELSEKLGLTSRAVVERIAGDLRACGLPVESSYDISALAEAMSKDKKAEGEKVRFVLIEDIGRLIMKDLRPFEVAELLESK